jgi:hypothetical protein
VNETCILFITAKLKIHLGFNKKLEKYLLDWLDKEKLYQIFHPRFVWWFTQHPLNSAANRAKLSKTIFISKKKKKLPNSESFFNFRWTKNNGKLLILGKRIFLIICSDNFPHVTELGSGWKWFASLCVFIGFF